MRKLTVNVSWLKHQTQKLGWSVISITINRCSFDNNCHFVRFCLCRCCTAITILAEQSSYLLLRPIGKYLNFRNRQLKKYLLIQLYGTPRVNFVLNSAQINGNNEITWVTSISYSIFILFLRVSRPLYILTIRYSLIQQVFPFLFQTFNSHFPIVVLLLRFQQNNMP